MLKQKTLIDSNGAKDGFTTAGSDGSVVSESDSIISSFESGSGIESSSTSRNGSVIKSSSINKSSSNRSQSSGKKVSL